jgi:hypothetical protein
VIDRSAPSAAALWDYGEDALAARAIGMTDDELDSIENISAWYEDPDYPLPMTGQHEPVGVRSEIDLRPTIHNRHPRRRTSAGVPCRAAVRATCVFRRRWVGLPVASFVQTTGGLPVMSGAVSWSSMPRRARPDHQLV